MTAIEKHPMLCAMVRQAWNTHVGNACLTDILHAAAIGCVSVGNRASDDVFSDLQFLRELAWMRVAMNQQHQQSMAILKSYMLKEQAS